LDQLAYSAGSLYQQCLLALDLAAGAVGVGTGAGFLRKEARFDKSFSNFIDL